MTARTTRSCIMLVVRHLHPRPNRATGLRGGNVRTRSLVLGGALLLTACAGATRSAQPVPASTTTPSIGASPGSSTPKALPALRPVTGAQLTRVLLGPADLPAAFPATPAPSTGIASVACGIAAHPPTSGADATIAQTFVNNAKGATITIAESAAAYTSAIEATREFNAFDLPLRHCRSVLHLGLNPLHVQATSAFRAPEIVGGHVVSSADIVIERETNVLVTLSVIGTRNRQGIRHLNLGQLNRLAADIAARLRLSASS